MFGSLKGKATKPFDIRELDGTESLSRSWRRSWMRNWRNWPSQRKYQNKSYGHYHSKQRHLKGLHAGMTEWMNCISSILGQLHESSAFMDTDTVALRFGWAFVWLWLLPWPVRPARTRARSKSSQSLPLTNRSSTKTSSVQACLSLHGIDMICCYWSQLVARKPHAYSDMNPPQHHVLLLFVQKEKMFPNSGSSTPTALPTNGFSNTGTKTSSGQTCHV